MLPSFATQIVTRLRPLTFTEDGHGNKIPDQWDEPFDIKGCSIQPNGTQEDLVNRSTVGITWSVFLPAESDIEAGDKLTIDGKDYRIVGEPDRWETGVMDHVRATVQRWEG